MTDLIEANERSEAGPGKPVSKQRGGTMQIGVDSFAAASPDDDKGVVVGASDLKSEWRIPTKIPTCW